MVFLTENKNTEADTRGCQPTGAVSMVTMTVSPERAMLTTGAGSLIITGMVCAERENNSMRQESHIQQKVIVNQQ